VDRPGASWETAPVGLSDDRGRILTPLTGTFGVFARNLGTGEVAKVNADQILPTESAAKTFILLHYQALCAPAIVIRPVG